MTLAQLKYFCKAVECENISKAAKELNVSQPSVTVAIKDLETELGVSLFIREKNRITPSREGMYFYSKIVMVLQDIDFAVGEVKIMSKDSRTITVGIPPMIGSFLTPALISRFHKTHPDYSIKVVEYKSETVKNMLNEYVIDFAVLLSTYTDGFAGKDIFKTEYGLYVSKENALAKLPLATGRDIKDEPFVVFDRIMFRNKSISEEFKKQEATPNIILVTSQLETIKNCVRQNLASTFIMDYCIKPCDMVVRVPHSFNTKSTVRLCWNGDKILTPAEKNFIKFADGIKDIL